MCKRVKWCSIISVQPYGREDRREDMYVKEDVATKLEMLG